MNYKKFKKGPVLSHAEGFIQHHFYSKVNDQIKLRNIIRENTKSGAGFTIIELIVVIAIISVLAGIVITSVSGYKKKANEAAVLAEFKQIKLLALDYYATNGKYEGFCTGAPVNPKLDDIMSAIVKLNPGNYNTRCYDKNYDNSWAKANNLIYIAYEYIFPVAQARIERDCTDDRYMVLLFTDYGGSTSGYCIDSDSSAPVSFTDYGPSIGPCKCQ